MAKQTRYPIVSIRVYQDTLFRTFCNNSLRGHEVSPWRDGEEKKKRKGAAIFRLTWKGREGSLDERPSELLNPVNATS